MLTESLTEDLLMSEVLPLALHLAKDPVANIRFTLAKTLEAIAPKVGKQASSESTSSRASHLRSSYQSVLMHVCHVSCVFLCPLSLLCNHDREDGRIGAIDADSSLFRRIGLGF